MALSRTERQILAGLSVSAVIAAVLHEVLELKEIGDAIQLQLLEDHYALLGIKETATETEITVAYKRQTSSFHSKLTTEEGRLKRAKLVTAYEILTSQAARAVYDNRRRTIAYATDALSIAGVVLLGLGALYMLRKLFMYWFKNTGYCVDPNSFEAKVVGTFANVKTIVKVDLHKDPQEKLGVQLAPAPDGKLRVESISPGGFVDTYNEKARAGTVQQQDDAQGLDWQSKLIQVGDTIVAANGVSEPAQITAALGSATTIQLELRRPLAGFFPWVCEAKLYKSTPDERWGCQMSVASDGSGTMEVLGVDPAGALERWNRENPRRRICIGDRIASVSQEFGSTKILARLQDSSVNSSTWVFFRGVKAGDRLPEVASGPLRKRDGEKLGIRIGAVMETPIRGAIVEVGEGKAVIVKEVVPGYLVDKWNKSHAQPVFEGATVLAVNGNTNPSEFAKELAKPTVSLRTRPPRGVTIKMCTERPEAPPKALDLAESPQRAPRSSMLPRWFRPKCFDVRLREMLTGVRCEFEVELCRAESCGLRVGLQLDKERELGGFVVLGVQGDGLVAAYNAGKAGGHCPTVKQGDVLIAVNDTSVPPAMIEHLANSAVEKLSLRFSRKPAEAAPGIWEATVERAPGEGWGVQLTEQQLGRGPKGCGPLLVDNVADNMAIDRWNQQAPSTTWPVKNGDLIVGCDDEVGHDKMLAKLKASHRVRLTLLRWHAGPAPGADDEELIAYQVVLEKSDASDKLGITLGPCSKNPTRTVLTMIREGGLVDKHNKRLMASNGSLEAEKPIVRVGDEVCAVNDQRNSSRFAEACTASRVELECRRRPGAGDAAGGVVANGHVTGGSVRSVQSTVASATRPAESIAGNRANSKPAAGQQGREDSEDRSTSGHAGAAAGATSASAVASRSAAAPPSDTPTASAPQSSAPAVVPPSDMPKASAPHSSAAAVAPPSCSQASAPQSSAPVVVPPSDMPKASAPQSSAPAVASPADTPKASEPQFSSPGASSPSDMADAAVTSQPSAPAQPPPQPSAADQKLAKDNFLLKAEVAQLKCQLAEARTNAAEPQGLKAELDTLRGERDALQAEVTRLKEARATTAGQAELDALTGERDALQAEVTRLKEESNSWQQRAEDHESFFSQVSELRAQELQRLRSISVSLGHSLSSGNVSQAPSLAASADEQEI